VFNKRIECIGINGTRVNLAYDIAIYSHGRKNAEVAAILKVYWIRNNATFGSPSMCSFSRTRIDTRFIEKNNLFWAPFCNFSNPGISKLFISLCTFFCKLTLVHNSKTDLFMRYSEFFKNITESPFTDCNLVPIIDFLSIFLQLTVWTSHNYLKNDLLSLSVCIDVEWRITLIISGVNFALLPCFFFPPSISPNNFCLLFAR